MRAASESSWHPSPLPPRDPSRPNRILVADDDADLLELIADGLRADGHDIVADADGGRLLVHVAAIYALAAVIAPVDLIVSDIRMPVCSGFDILAAIRDACWPTPVILMTAFGGKDVRQRATRLGAIVFDKPFELSALREKVGELLPSLLGRPASD
jgi:CheY-like chemotaxis protein